MNSIEKLNKEVEALDKILRVLSVLFPIALIAVAIYSFIKIQKGVTDIEQKRQRLFDFTQ